MERKNSIQRAQEMVADAQEKLRICEYVENSRLEKPNAQVFLELDNHLAELAARKNRLPSNLKYYEERREIAENLIRILASTEKPMWPQFLFEVHNMVSDSDLLTVQSTFWEMVGESIRWTNGQGVILSPEVREQFK